MTALIERELIIICLLLLIMVGFYGYIKLILPIIERREMKTTNTKAIAKNKEIEINEAHAQMILRLEEAKTAFAGFTDLKIIFEFIERGSSTITVARKDYAEVRGTDIYGVKKIR